MDGSARQTSAAGQDEQHQRRGSLYWQLPAAQGIHGKDEEEDPAVGRVIPIHPSVS